MADRFVFSNFAVAALQDAVDSYVQEFEIHPNDVPKFPRPTQGVKFPLVLQDTQGSTEICYATSLSDDGVMVVERGRENTTARSWLAGTQVLHTMTAATITASAKLVPKGAWSSTAEYYNGDVVVYAGVSYIAVNTNLNSVPTAENVNWQVLYQPPGASSAAMAFRNAWSSTTLYAVGEVVSYEGRTWVAKAASTGEVPSSISGANYWDRFSPSSTWFQNMGVFRPTGSDSLIIDATNAEGNALPVSLYDGMTLKIIPAATNTLDTVTLTIGALAPKPLRNAPGEAMGIGRLKPGVVYEVTYLAATEEFVLHRSAAIKPQDIPFTPNSGGTLSAQTVHDALVELDSEKASYSGSYTWTGVQYWNTTQVFKSEPRIEYASPRFRFYDTATGGLNRYILNSGGLLGFLSSTGSWNFYVDNSGNGWFQSNVTAYSDARLKKDLDHIQEAMAKIRKLYGYDYTRTDTGERQTGLLAQDVQAVKPEAVSEGADGMLGVAYGNLAGLFVEALKELDNRITALERRS